MHKLAKEIIKDHLGDKTKIMEIAEKLAVTVCDLHVFAAGPQNCESFEKCPLVAALMLAN